MGYWIPNKPKAKYYDGEESKIFEQPCAHWLTGKKHSYNQIKSHASRLLRYAGEDIVVFVLYAIPDRDAGQYSSGGLDYDAYMSYVDGLVDGIGDNDAIVIIEPDALCHCIKGASSVARLGMLEEVIGKLSKTNAKLYLDVGNPRWINFETVAQTLETMDIPDDVGFSINVSNFIPTKECVAWGNRLSHRLGSKRTYVVDTSRNGIDGYDGEWCNPEGMGCGIPSTEYTASELCDAYLWIKVPGESDGNKGNAPMAGQFYPRYAEGLVSRSPYIK